MEQTPDQFLADGESRFQAHLLRLHELKTRFELVTAMDLWQAVNTLSRETIELSQKLDPDGAGYAPNAARLIIFVTRVNAALSAIEDLIAQQQQQPGQLLEGADAASVLRGAPARVWSLIQRVDAARRAPGEHDLGRLREDVETFGEQIIALHGAEGPDPDTQVTLARFLQNLGSEVRELLRKQAAG